ncbi:MAG: hypothetical protein ACI9MR_001358 [Myxococcota bacterium]|jgi:hypothetical protein
METEQPDPIDDGLNESVVEATVHKLEKLGLEFATKTNPKLEKMGFDRFAHHDKKFTPIDRGEVVHILDDKERSRILQISRNVILIAFGIGALSGLASAVASFTLSVPEHVTTTFWEDFRDFLIVNGVTIVATLIEVAILYRVALRAVHLIAREAGIQLVPRDGLTQSDEDRAVALALCRCALELPNPPENPFGIDPYREFSKWRVVISVIIFKLKITLTNFILRIAIRRVGGRAIVKAYLTFTDVFVTGAWDALVAWRMIRQARVRALGPSACETLLSDILKGEGAVRREVFAVMVRAVATTIVRSRDVHPNLLALMRAIHRRAGTFELDELDDGVRFIDALDALEPHERGLVLEVLVLASFPDGKVSRAEMAYLETVLAAESRVLDRPALKALCRAFVRGERLDRRQIQDVIDPLPAAAA